VNKIVIIYNIINVDLLLNTATRVDNISRGFIFGRLSPPTLIVPPQFNKFKKFLKIWQLKALSETKKILNHIVKRLRIGLRINKLVV
jgi:hypothetical protein